MQGHLQSTQARGFVKPFSKGLHKIPIEGPLISQAANMPREAFTLVSFFLSCVCVYVFVCVRAMWPLKAMRSQ